MSSVTVETPSASMPQPPSPSALIASSPSAQHQHLTPISWSKAMVYERVEFINTLQRWTGIRALRNDEVVVEEVERYICSSGLDPQIETVLCLSGRAARERELLYLRIVRQVRQYMISDLDMNIRFGAHVGDRIPQRVTVQALSDGPQFRAMKYWTRAMWAMRSGIVRKIAETRAMTQHRINATSSMSASSSASKRKTSLFLPTTQQHTETAKGAEGASGDALPVTTTAHTEVPMLNAEDLLVEGTAKTKKRPFVPMQVYHAECSAPTLPLDRLLLNAPSLIVFWASWDTSSVEWLAKNVFHGLAVNKSHEDGDVRNDNGDAVDPSQRFFFDAKNQGDDPWVQLIKRYTYVPPPVTWDDVMPIAAKGAKKKVRQRTTAIIAPPAGGAKSSSSASPSGAAGPIRTSSLRKRANLVLVCLDGDRETGSIAFSDLMRRGQFWKSADVSFSSTWVGPEGMQSPLAMHFDVCSLPLVVACEPEIAPGVMPKIRLVEDFNKGAAVSNTQRQNVTNEAGGLMRRITLPLWHDVPGTSRLDILTKVSSVLANHDAPLVLESEIITLYPRPEEDEDVYRTESDLLFNSKKRSNVRIVGSSCTTVTDILKEELSVLSGVRNSEINITVFPPSPGVTVTFDELTAEHRVKGWYCNITCTHCKKAVRTDVEPSYRCLNCVPQVAGMCKSCFEGRVHPAHHIVAKFRPRLDLVRQECLWGSGNVTHLPTMQGKLVTSITGYHHDVFCNGCKTAIHGERWKCCCCHEYDLCGRCEEQWWRGGGGKYSCTTVLSGPKVEATWAHPTDHYFMYVRCAVPGDPSCFLRPKLAQLVVSE